MYSRSRACGAIGKDAFRLIVGETFRFISSAGVIPHLTQVNTNTERSERIRTLQYRDHRPNLSRRLPSFGVFEVYKSVELV